MYKQKFARDILGKSTELARPFIPLQKEMQCDRRYTYQVALSVLSDQLSSTAAVPVVMTCMQVAWNIFAKQQMF